MFVLAIRLSEYWANLRGSCQKDQLPLKETIPHIFMASSNIDNVDYSI